TGARSERAARRDARAPLRSSVTRAGRPCAGSARSRTLPRPVGPARRSPRVSSRSSLEAEHTSAVGDLFSDAAAERLPDVAPLALRMRPQTLDEFVAQKHVLGEGSALRLAIEQDRMTSAVLYGPPGSGKTTLARIVA